MILERVKINWERNDISPRIWLSILLKKEIKGEKIIYFFSFPIQITAIPLAWLTIERKGEEEQRKERKMKKEAEGGEVTRALEIDE